MAKKKQPKAIGAWGIEVGQCAFKALRLEKVEDRITATAFDYIEYPKILNQPDADPDQLTREALLKFLERNNIRGDTVVLGVPGQSGLARFVKLPPVEEKKIADIIRFEAKQQIPFPLDEVIWDYQKIGSGVVTEDGFAMETEIGLFAMKRDMIQRFLQQFNEVDAEVHIVQMAPLALCNFIAYSCLGKRNGASGEPNEKSTAIKSSPGKSDKKRCVVALDIGTDNSNLVITDGEGIIWQRAIPKGGNHFTRALTKELKLTFAKAEHVKKNATKSPDLRRILMALRPELNEFVTEVQRSLGYFANTHRDAHVEYMVGLGNAFRLPGLQKYLSEKLKLDVRRLTKIEGLEGDGVVNAPTFVNNVMGFGTVYGLALQGLGVSLLTTNLLPEEIKTERMIRAKKPWVAATAAAILFGCVGTLAGYAIQYNAVAGSAVEDAANKAKAFNQKVKTQETNFQAENRKVQANQEAIEWLTAGQYERLNWILLNKYIDDCLPVPALRIDGTFQGLEGNIVKLVDIDGKERQKALDASTHVLVNNRFVDARQLKPGTHIAIVYQTDPGTLGYWKKPEAKQAYLSYWEKQSGQSAKTSGDEEGIQDRIQVNITAMLPLFCNDLATYLNNLKQRQKDEVWMPKTIYIDGKAVANPDLTTPPKAKSGWVVELRGYTYHRDGYRFVMATLVENLASKARTRLPASAGSQGTVPQQPAAPGAVPSPQPQPQPKPNNDAKNNNNKEKPTQSQEERDFQKVIADRISHVTLYRYIVAADPDRSKFFLINNTYLPELLGNTTPSPWTPLGSVGNVVGDKNDQNEITAPRTGTNNNNDNGQNTPQPAQETKGIPRTEFVIHFIWDEPVQFGYGKNNADAGTTVRQPSQFGPQVPSEFGQQPVGPNQPPFPGQPPPPVPRNPGTR
ncbi:MAG: hypothetical protein KatS3mg105_3937 [Gemmatales bacterium]|nr:MAG: hypothetical protein KatS3mg105_3937 [Gemmatales bacterium]